MKGRVCSAIAHVLVMLTIAGSALAQSPATSIIGTEIRLGGMSPGGVPEPRTFKSITVNDAAGVPMPGIPVTIDFAGCAGGEFQVCSVQGFPGMADFCPPDPVVSAITDAAGVATFEIIGHHEGGVFNAAPCAVVSAGVPAVVLGALTASAFDNGLGGVNPADVARVLLDSFSYTCCAAYRTRSDFDGDGDIDPADVAMELAVSFSTVTTGSSALSCAAGTCPP